MPNDLMIVLTPVVGVLGFVLLWLVVLRYLARKSGWPLLAARFPGGARPDGQRFYGQVSAIGRVTERGITALVIAPEGLYLYVAVLPFRIGRSPALVPWNQIRYAGEAGRFRQWGHEFDLAAVTTVRVKQKACDAIMAHLGR